MKEEIKTNLDYNYWHQEAYHLDLKKNLRLNFKMHDIIINSLKIEKNRKLLDIACGKGVFLKEIEKRHLDLDLSGLDISEVAINVCKKLVHGHFTTDDAENLPYPDKIFDYVTCLGGLEYYQNPKQGAREMARVLKRGGKVSIQVPNLMFLGHVYLAYRDGAMPSEAGEGGKYYNYEIEKFFTYQGWRDILEKAGFKILSCKKYNSILGSKKVHPIVKFIYNQFIQYLLPLNLSYCFIFTAEKK